MISLHTSSESWNTVESCWFDAYEKMITDRINQGPTSKHIQSGQYSKSSMVTEYNSIMLTIEFELCMLGQFRNYSHVYKLPRIEASPNRSIVVSHHSVAIYRYLSSRIFPPPVCDRRSKRRGHCEI